MDLQEFKKTGALELTPEDFNDPGTMLVVDNMLAKLQAGWDEEIKMIASALDIPKEWADCVWYLRTRSRWTQELENKLISMAREGGIPPDMCSWPYDQS